MKVHVKNDRSIAAHIAQSLAGRIVSGEIPPGEHLRQDYLAAEFGASHVPVREAFSRLAAQGLVVIEPRRGVRVASLDPDAVLEVAEMRAVLEPLALRHAMSKIDDNDLDAARKHISTEVPNDNVSALEEVNRAFHLAIIEPCAMPRLLADIVDLHKASARHLFATWKQLGWQHRSDEEHRAILTAMEAGNVDVACRLLASHIASAGQALAQALRG